MFLVVQSGDFKKVGTFLANLGLAGDTVGVADSITQCTLLCDVLIIGCVDRMRGVMRGCVDNVCESIQSEGVCITCSSSAIRVSQIASFNESACVYVCMWMGEWLWVVGGGIASPVARVQSENVTKCVRVWMGERVVGDSITCNSSAMSGSSLNINKISLRLRV